MSQMREDPRRLLQEIEEAAHLFTPRELVRLRRKLNTEIARLEAFKARDLN